MTDFDMLTHLLDKTNQKYSLTKNEKYYKDYRNNDCIHNATRIFVTGCYSGMDAYFDNDGNILDISIYT
jgi:hypothetical protein